MPLTIEEVQAVRHETRCHCDLCGHLIYESSSADDLKEARGSVPAFRGCVIIKPRMIPEKPEDLYLCGLCYRDVILPVIKKEMR